jgi:hypothetical protein
VSSETLKTLNVSLVRLKLEIISFVWTPIDVYVNRIERVQKKFDRDALRGLW